jgi:hypothetical protein
MNKEINAKIIVLCMLMFVLGCALTAILFTTQSVPRSEVIRHGAAYHHPETGELMWIDDG